MKTTKPPITTFKDQPYQWLSNMEPCKGISFRKMPTNELLYFSCVESAYQAVKTTDIEVQQLFCPLDGMAAKKLGGQMKRAGTLQLRSDWNNSRLWYMKKLLQMKFGPLNPELQTKLIETFPAELIEGNYWKDYFWGVCNGRGENNLGKLLMEVRSELMIRQDRGQL